MDEEAVGFDEIEIVSYSLAGYWLDSKCNI